MSNIQSSRGVQTPAFQPASSKGDGGGNGSGGMYFGQGGQEEEQATDLFESHYHHEPDAGDIPFTFPLLQSLSEALASWKAALAQLLYQDIRKQK